MNKNGSRMAFYTILSKLVSQLLTLMLWAKHGLLFSLVLSSNPICVPCPCKTERTSDVNSGKCSCWRCLISFFSHPAPQHSLDEANIPISANFDFQQFFLIISNSDIFNKFSEPFATIRFVQQVLRGCGFHLSSSYRCLPSSYSLTHLWRVFLLPSTPQDNLSKALGRLFCGPDEK